MLIFFGILSIFSAVMYHLGGLSKSSKWYDFACNTRTRDVGCSLINILFLGFFIQWHWSLIIIFGLFWGSYSTYFKRKGQSAKWYNWLFVGLALSCSVLPYIYFIVLWKGFFIRLLINTLGIMGWSERTGDAKREELGRGFINFITLSYLLL